MVNHNYSPSQQKGFSIENVARDYLEKNNLIFIDKNYRSRFGEIDLIMKDPQKTFSGGTLVFVEVRYRKSNFFGHAIESIGYYKQKRLIHTAQMYLIKYHRVNTPPCRFDVVVVSGKITDPAIEWIVNAFECL